jgi:hypothetical protein
MRFIFMEAYACSCIRRRTLGWLSPPTEHQFYDAIVEEFIDVVQHSVLKKWLYLPEATEDFETVASDIVETVRMNDQRFGVEPEGRKRKKGAKGNGKVAPYSNKIAKSS